jgi:hypothetical protein
MVEFDGRQIAYLVLGQFEEHSFGAIDVSDGTDRDGDLLLAPEMALVQEHMGHVVITRVDDKALDVADGSVGGVHVVAPPTLHVTVETQKATGRTMRS